MTTFVAGATGATGLLLVDQLLGRGQHVIAIVRSPEKLPGPLRNHERLSVVQASILELSEAEMRQHVSSVAAVASCLGHTMSFEGIYGQPRMLVTDAVRRLCDAIRANQVDKPARFVLMSTVGYRNPDLDALIPFRERFIKGVYRRLLPPFLDNERAADYLRTTVGQNDPAIEWAAVRPDNLLDEPEVSEYEVYPSPIRSALFGGGTTSRINVGHFMARLIIEDDTWKQWKGQMPVIYNKSPDSTTPN